jgi:PAS domain S-box-containing protein
MPGRLAETLLVTTLLGAVVEPAGAVAGPPSAIGVLVYADPEWQRAFVHDGRRLIAVAIAADAKVPPPGRRVEVRGSDVTDLGAAALPDAAPLGTDEPVGLRWVSVEGTLRAVVSANEDRTFLRVTAQRLDVDVHLPASPQSATHGAPQPGARLRLRGVLEPAPDAWSRPRLWVAGWDEATLLARAAAWDDVRAVTVPEVRALARAGSADEVRVVGRAVARRSQRSFAIATDLDAITAELDRPEIVQEGNEIEVRGFATMRRGEPTLVDGRWRPKAADPQAYRHDPGLPVLTTVAQVRALSRAESDRGYPVRLEATATFASLGYLFVQDDTGGVYVSVARGPAPLATGERAIVGGFTAPGRLAPIVVDPVVQRLGRARLPAPLRDSPARLAAGFDDCRRVETTGYVRRVRRLDGETEILLGIEGLRVPVHVPLEMEDETLPRLDSRVRVTAVCGTTFNWRRIFDHVELYAATPQDVAVEEPAGDPFALPLLPARDLLRSAPGGRWERLVRTRGVVLHHRDGQPLYLRSESGTVVAETSGAEPVVPGDVVDVVGFPAPGGAPRLEEALYRRIGRSRPPSPIPASSGDLLSRALEAELARTTATLLEVVPQDTGSLLVLQAAGGVVEAEAGGDLAPPPPEHSTVEVTGILVPHERGIGSGPALQMLLRSPADLRVVAQPPWLTPVRTAELVSGLAAAALLAFAWVATLRRRVVARTSELAATEERYRLLADNASDVILTTDADLRITYVSPSVTRDSGYTAAEVLELSLERVITPESWAHVREALARAGERPRHEPVELGVEMIRKDGTRRFMHVRARAMRDAAGRLTGYCAAARDVTARRQAERELARLATAIEQSGDAIVLTDPQATILYVNPAFERFTGYSASEVLGGNPRILKSGVHDPAFYETMWKTLRAGATWEGRFTNRRKDGRIFLEDASISPVRDREGRLIGYVAVKRDVTRQVQLENQLVQAQKMEAIGRLAAGVAHDFNNVLAIILSLSDLALQRGDANERIHKCVDGIREAAMRAGGLTRQILTFSRQSPAAVQPLDPREVVGEAAGMLRHLVPRGVDVRVRLDSTVSVAADPTQIHQVVLNLGTNAGLAMNGTGGVVEVVLEDAEVDGPFAEGHPPLRAGACLRLVVQDRGCGMTRETLAHIFEPFFTTRAPRDGTGMGLAVVHGIVLSHGGAITVESHLGRGSTFCVYLPALPPGRARMEAATSAIPPQPTSL